MALHAVAATAAALPLPGFLWRTRNTRTGGPDDGGGDEEQLRVLMPILAAVILVAALFS